VLRRGYSGAGRPAGLGQPWSAAVAATSRGSRASDGRCGGRRRCTGSGRELVPPERVAPCR